MLVLPWQLPNLVPDHGALTPAAVIPKKSVSAVAAKVATVRVIADWRLEDLTNNLRIALAPLAVKVPETVWLAEKITGVIPVAEGAVKIKLLKVLAPVTLTRAGVALLKVTL